MAVLRMVATDLDGTFLSSDGTASAENIDAALSAANRGIKLVFATGRPSRWLQVLQPLAMAHPQVLSSNGAVTFDLQTHTVIDYDPVPIAETIAVAKDLRAAMPEIAFAVEYTQGWGRDNRFPVRGDRVEADVQGDVEHLLTQRIAVKLLAVGWGIDTHRMADLAMPISQGRLNCTFSMITEHGLMELSAIGVDKASGLRKLMAADQIRPDELAAFGDMPNDIPMLEMAGHGFAMANAHPSLLKRFRVAGNHNESGFARTLRRLLDESD